MDAEIAEAFSCRPTTVENIRQRFVELGFEQTLERKKPQTPPANKLLDGRQEAQIIATRLGPPPAGYACWTLRLLGGGTGDRPVHQPRSCPQDAEKTA